MCVVQAVYLMAGGVFLHSCVRDELVVLNAAKTAILMCSMLLVINHAFQPLPPQCHRSVDMFDDGIGMPGPCSSGVISWKRC